MNSQEQSQQCSAMASDFRLYQPPTLTLANDSVRLRGCRPPENPHILTKALAKCPRRSRDEANYEDSCAIAAPKFVLILPIRKLRSSKVPTTDFLLLLLFSFFLFYVRKSTNGSGSNAGTVAPTHHGSRRAEGQRQRGATKPVGFLNRRGAQSPSDDESEIPGGGPAPGDGGNLRRRFACPFYVQNPIRYYMCARFNLRDATRVQQHLKRKHREREACDRCGHTFERELDPAAYQQHVQECTHDHRAPRNVMPPRTLNAATWNLIQGNRRPCNQLDEDRWYTLWDMLFPGQARPPSVYMTRIEVVQDLATANNRFQGGNRGVEEIDEIIRNVSEEVKDFILTFAARILAAPNEAEGRVQPLVPAPMAGPGHWSPTQGLNTYPEPRLDPNPALQPHYGPHDLILDPTSSDLIGAGNPTFWGQHEAGTDAQNFEADHIFPGASANLPPPEGDSFPPGSPFPGSEY